MYGMERLYFSFNANWRLALASHRCDESRTGKKNACNNSTKQNGYTWHNQVIETENIAYLKFSKEEISKLPKVMRKELRLDGCSVRVRKRNKDGYRCSYEIRYRRNGYNVSASGKTLDLAKANFLEKIKHAEKVTKKTKLDNVPKNFIDFALFWVENYHKRKVVEQTYKDTKYRINTTLKKYFDDKLIKNIQATDIQKLLDDFEEAGKGRTAEQIYSILNQVFKYAVRFNVAKNNPVEIVFFQKHERKHGKALSLEEEKLLLEKTAGTKYQLMFAVALYTGMRPNEYKTAKITGDMIIANNSKRKKGKIEFKRIPIVKMLKPYLNNVDTIQWVKLDKIRAKFKEILPNHKLYDLRTTFYTHCQMCGISESARDEIIGHSSNSLKNTYTDLPDEYIIQEGQKLVW